MMEERLSKLGKKIDDMAEKGKKLKGEMKAEFNRILTDLRYKKYDAERKLKDMHNATGEALGGLKNKAGKVMDDMEQGFKSLVSKFIKEETEAEKREKEYRKHQREKYHDSIILKLEEFDKIHGDIDVKIKGMDENARIGYEKGLVILKEEKKNVRKILGKIKSLDGKEFDNLKIEIDTLTADLQKSYKGLKSINS